MTLAVLTAYRQDVLIRVDSCLLYRLKKCSTSADTVCGSCIDEVCSTVHACRIVDAQLVQVKNDVWALGDALCDTWVALDVMCCTASILNLAAISVDR